MLSSWDLSRLAEHQGCNGRSAVCSEWSTESSFELKRDVDVEKLKKMVTLLDKDTYKSIRQAAKELNSGLVGGVDGGMCAVYSATRSVYFVLFKRDQKEAAHKLFNIQDDNAINGDSNVRPEAGIDAPPPPRGQRLTPVGLRLVVFDFDQTLTIFHVFKSLAGWLTGRQLVPEPYASTELGQMRRMAELSQLPAFPLGFPHQAFGGDGRIKAIREMLEMLKGHGVAIYICTRGLVGVAKACLLDVGLSEFFSEVYGCRGDQYGVKAYDEEARAIQMTADERKLMGTRMHSEWRTKDMLVSALMRRMDLRKDEALMVDDDPEEIARTAPLCRTLWVQEAKGLTTDHLGMIETMADSKLRRIEHASWITESCTIC